MAKPKIPLLIANGFHPETIDRLDGLFDTYKLWTLPPAGQKRLIERLSPECKAVATASWQTSPSIYDLQNLEIIACFGVGVDGIDFGTTRARNILVTNTPGVLNDAVADLAMGLVIATQRNFTNADQFSRRGSWKTGSFPFGNSLAGRTLGIIGLGAIGEEIAKRALPFKLNIAYHNRHRKEVPYAYYDSIADLARQSDILLSMLPGGDSTENLIDKHIFSALGRGGTFINVGRGTCVDEKALIEALRKGTIASAGLDVYCDEPNIPSELIELENVILLPHIGSATVETRRAMGNLVIENLLAWQQGLPPMTAV